MSRLLLRGGLIVDGTGSEPYESDLAIDQGRIVEIGADLSAGDAEVVEVAGRVVTPGFIDLHSHADYTVIETPAAPTQLAQGVTTLLLGNCGMSPFPRPRETFSFLGEPTWSGDTAADFAASLQACEPAVNLALQVGHSPLRAAVVGADDVPASVDDLARMVALVDDAAAAGAFGISTGLIYAPGAYADGEELAHLLTAAARRGLIWSTHMRSESGGLLAAVTESLELAGRAGIGLEISHLKAIGPAHHGTVRAALELIDAARAEGVDVQADVYPYTATSTSLMSRLPAWVLAGGPAAMQLRLADPDRRAAVVAELDARLGRDFTAEGLVLSALGPGPFADRAGDSIAVVATDLGLAPAEAICAVLAAHGSEVAVVNHALAEADVVEVLTHDAVSVASDGWILADSGEGHPHPRSFGTFPRVLAHHVRQQGELSLAAAIHKMTGLPARRLGLGDRGVITPGGVADLIVLDPDAIQDRSTYLDPWQLSTGVDHVLINGGFARRDGADTTARRGRVLRRS